jgi:rare lipoprotein A
MLERDDDKAGTPLAGLRIALLCRAVHIPLNEADACGGIPDPLVRAVGSGQFGKAAWYNLVGKQTAGGDILDAVTPTAAHRSLPLASFAKVTNVHNDRSVIVKINDRGPYTRGRILDLSPRAADALDMKRAGVTAVVVEPLVNLCFSAKPGPRLEKRQHTEIKY